MHNASRIPLFALICFGLCQVRASAVIVVEGNAAEKQEIREAISSLRTKSAVAEKLYKQLEDRTESYTIRFGVTAKGGHANLVDRIATIDKTVLGCTKFVDNQAGNGGAAESFALDMVIAHEMIGHLHMNTFNEGNVVQQMNRVRVEAGYVPRVKYLKTINGRTYVNFLDQSRIDVTDAMSKNTKKNGIHKVGIQLDTSGQIQVVGMVEPDGSMRVSLDPVSAGSTLEIDTRSLGNGVQLVDISDFSLVLEDVASAQADDPNTSIDEFLLAFDSTLLGTEASGLNLIDDAGGNYSGAGSWDFDGSPSDFSFDVGGLFLLTNDLYESEEAFSTATLVGTMQYDSAADAWNGTVNLQGHHFVAVPEPTVWFGLLLGFCGSCARRRRSFLAATPS